MPLAATLRSAVQTRTTSRRRLLRGHLKTFFMRNLDQQIRIGSGLGSLRFGHWPCVVALELMKRSTCGPSEM